MSMNPFHEQAKFWHDTTLNNLELLRATYIQHAFTPHTHEGFAIGVVMRGAERFMYRGSQHVSPAGHLVVINPGEVHTGEAAVSEGWTYRMIYPAADILQQAATELTGKPQDVPFFAEPVINDPPLANLFLRLHATLEDPASTAIERESILLWWLNQLIARHADCRPNAPPVTPENQYARQIKAYLDAHYADNIPLATLAKQVNLSRFHLLRVFRDVVGLPPHAYLNQLRVNHAKRLLLAGFPIADVATTTGFTDQSHLTKRFKRVVGVTPGQFRLAP